MPSVRRRTSRARKLAFAAILGVLTILVIEVGAWIVFWIATGRPLAFGMLRVEQAEVLGTAAALDSTDSERKLASNEMSEFHRPHPYVGFVIDPDQNVPARTAYSGFPVSRFGMRDDKDPIQKRGPDRFVVGVFGGSVAGMVFRYASDRFEATLRRHPALANKRIVVVRAALGGYKQPQQLMSLQYLLALGAEFDAVISLDGFNEVALGEPVQDQGMEFPYGWETLVGTSADAEVANVRARSAMLLDLRRRLATLASGAPWRWSATVALVWKLADRSLDSAISRSRVGPATPSAEVPTAERVPVRVALWKRCALAMDASCRAVGTRYLHVLQPNQYFPDSKPMSDGERALAFDPNSSYRGGVELGYPLLLTAGRELSESGVHFHDSTQLFAHHTDSLYIDRCCHLGQTGNELLAEDIAKALLEILDLPSTPPLTAESVLSVDRDHVELTRLLQRDDLHVFAEEPGQPAREVSFAGLAWTTSDPHVVSVDNWGQIVARGLGRAIVTASHGDRRLDFDVSVDLADISILPGARSTRGDDPPHLAAELLSDSVRFHITHARQGTTAIVALSFQPNAQPMCGGTAYVQLGTPFSVSAPITDADTLVSVPLPPTLNEELLIAQAFVQESSSLCGWSMSDALVIRLDRRR